jgi:hypothetical protein
MTNKTPWQRATAPDCTLSEAWHASPYVSTDSAPRNIALVRAFRFHRGRMVGPRALRISATAALAFARQDVEQGKARWPGHGTTQAGAPDEQGLRYVENPTAMGLRLVGYVQPEFRHARVWHDGDMGYYDNPYSESCRDGSGLIFGAVFQLPGRNGESRFVAGYVAGGDCGDGATIDLGRVFTDPRGDYYAAPGDLDAARDAARAADSIAEHAAEQAREHETAWRAGSEWRDTLERIKDARREYYALNVERRMMRRRLGAKPGPALICATIREKLLALADEIGEARDRMAELARGDDSRLCFYPSDVLRAAFCDGADLPRDAFPA